MKMIWITLIAASIVSCKSDQSVKKDTIGDDQVSNGQSAEDPNIPGTWAPAGELGLVFHYVCPDRCYGGILDDPGNCPICGKQLHHNSAYHFNNNNPTETPAADFNLAPPRNTADDPPQSASGLWHFNCPNGHDGAGEAGACTECGAELMHNTLYHTDEETQDEPPQNENGTWHFVCEDGHEGGAGAPIKCNVCDKILVHNEEYHH